MSLQERFDTAAENIRNINKTLSDDELKAIYALFKQGSVGDINVPKPGMLDFKGKAKWESWNAKKGMSQDEAKEAYIKLSEELIVKHGLKS